MAVMMDNASNNDTMMEAIEDRCRNACIEFSAKQARMRSCVACHILRRAWFEDTGGIKLITHNDVKGFYLVFFLSPTIFSSNFFFFQSEIQPLCLTQVKRLLTLCLHVGRQPTKCCVCFSSFIRN